MRSFSIVLAAGIWFATSPLAPAQTAGNGGQTAEPQITTDLSPGMVPATPEMWFYEQERLRRKDPREAVRAKAEFRSYQRRLRLAAVKWYGYSNSRPTVTVAPFMGSYSHQWSGNSYDGWGWRVAPRSYVVYRIPADN